MVCWRTWYIFLSLSPCTLAHASNMYMYEWPSVILITELRGHPKTRPFSYWTNHRYESRGVNCLWPNCGILDNHKSHPDDLCHNAVFHPRSMVFCITNNNYHVRPSICVNMQLYCLPVFGKVDKCIDEILGQCGVWRMFGECGEYHWCLEHVNQIVQVADTEIIRRAGVDHRVWCGAFIRETIQVHRIVFGVGIL